MRETKKFKTKNGGVEVELYTYLTGREARELREVFLQNTEMKTEGDITKIEGLKGTIVKEAEDKAIDLVVVSINGKTENVLNAILDLPNKDYEEIMEEINKISAFGTFPQKKTK